MEYRVRRFFLLTTLALLPALFCSAPVMAATAKPKTATAAKGAYPLLPAGPGRDVEIRVCSQCHSPDRPAAQRHAEINQPRATLAARMRRLGAADIAGGLVHGQVIKVWPAAAPAGI